MIAPERLCGFRRDMRGSRGNDLLITRGPIVDISLEDFAGKIRELLHMPSSITASALNAIPEGPST